MNLKKIALVFFATVTTGSVVTIAAVSNDSLLTLATDSEQCAVCSGNHYSVRKATSTATGCKAYWVCCTCHHHYLSTSEIPGYDAENWTADADVTEAVEVVDSSDDRYLASVTDFTSALNQLGFGNVTQNDDGTYTVGGFTKTDVTTLTIPEGVSSLEANTFKNKTKLATLVLPASFTTLTANSLKNVGTCSVYCIDTITVESGYASGNAKITIYEVLGTGWKYDTDGVTPKGIKASSK